MSMAASQIDPALRAPIGRTPALRGVAEAGRTSDGSFKEHLDKARGGLDGDDAREAARSLVAIALVQPVLAMLRESSTAEGPFAPSPGERRFGPMLDQQIADRITQRANFPLVERIAEQLQATGARRTGGEAASAAAVKEGHGT